MNARANQVVTAASKLRKDIDRINNVDGFSTVGGNYLTQDLLHFVGMGNNYISPETAFESLYKFVDKVLDVVKKGIFIENSWKFY